ncbi:hypothetical protein LZ30DRAFT_173153 [Colletotrichum cereale]|nr:hypothetical protein LZ30DRAFT_173153 [Colletotrichum cereale]
MTACVPVLLLVSWLSGSLFVSCRLLPASLVLSVAQSVPAQLALPCPALLCLSLPCLALHRTVMRPT